MLARRLAAHRIIRKEDAPGRRRSYDHAMRRAWVMIDWVVALALSAYVVFLVSGAQKDNTRHAVAAAAIVVLAMTLPVAWRRRAPIAVAIVLGIGGIAKDLIIGPMIRCGPALPALLLGAYAIGRFQARIDSRWTLLGISRLSATTQCLTDPRLQPGVMVVMGPMIIGLFFVGLLVRIAQPDGRGPGKDSLNWSIIAGDEQSWRSRQTACGSPRGWTAHSTPRSTRSERLPRLAARC